MPNKVCLHRVVNAPAERVYRAFLDPAALTKWLPPHGFTATVHHLDATVGGTFKMSFINFSSGTSHTFGGTYLTLEPHSKIVYNDQFDDPNLPGVMHVTITLTPVSCGTEIHIVQEGIPDVIPTEQCYLGWQQSLAMFMQLVEPTIPDH